MNTFYLEILTPERAFYTGDCTSLVIPISDGMLGIQAGHTPLTAAIMDGEVHFTTPEGERIVCAVMRGMVDMTGNRARVLCESAVSPDEIDEVAERRNAEEAAMELKKEQSRLEYQLWQLSFNKAVTRLKTKEHNKKVNF